MNTANTPKGRLSIAPTATSHGVEYTAAEKTFLAAAVTAALILADATVPKPVHDKEVAAMVSAKIDAMIAEKADRQPDIVSVVSACYRDKAKGHIAEQTAAGKTPKEIEATDFPKVRDPTSIRLLTREALTAVGCADIQNEVAPKYGNGKNAKKRAPKSA